MPSSIYFFPWDCHCQDKSSFSPCHLLTMLRAGGTFSSPLQHQFSLQVSAYLKLLCCKIGRRNKSLWIIYNLTQAKLKIYFTIKGLSYFEFPWMWVARKRGMSMEKKINPQKKKNLTLLGYLGLCKTWSWKVNSSIKSSLSLLRLH